MIVTIEVDDRATQRALSGMLLRGTDFSGPFRSKAQRLMEKGFAINFMTEGAATGHPWPPREQPYPWPPLMQTGKMFRSFVQLRGFPNTVGPLWATFGSDSKIAWYHQEGTRHMPARPPGEVPEHTYTQIGDALAEHIIGTEDVSGGFRTLRSMRSLFK